MSRFLLLLVAMFSVLLLSPIGARAEEPLIRRSAVDPAQRVGLESWWNRFRAAEPALALTARSLRGTRDRWRSEPSREGCRRARKVLVSVDREGLLRGAEYLAVVELATALEEFDGAAEACIEHRYFELEYRLWLAESGLERLRARLSRRLARQRHDVDGGGQAGD